VVAGVRAPVVRADAVWGHVVGVSPAGTAG